MKKWITILFIVLVFSLGVFVRFYKLGSVPNSLNWDEVSWGYNAYSILTTGKDEYGIFLPLSFRAFGDFKQPVYVYLTTIPIKLFGLTPFAVRFTSAFFGSLSVLCLYFLVLEFFWKDKNKNLYALVTMTLFAFSPWSIQFSRVAYEANVALSFIILGLLLFFVGIRKNNTLSLLVGTFFLSLSTYTYHSEKVLTPIIFIGVCIFSYKYFLTYKKIAVAVVIFFLICSSLSLLDTRTTQRGRSVLFISNPTQVLGRSVEKITYEKSLHLPLANIVHNRRLIYAGQFLSNYLSHFSPKYLFLTGDQGQHHAPDMGILYLFSLPFILLGMYVLLRMGFSQSWFVFFWLLVAPLASSLAIDAPNASRNLIMAPTWDILTAVGFVSAYFALYKRKLAILGFVLVGISILFSFTYYFHQYFVHTNKESGQYWQYGYRQSVETAQKLDDGKRKIYFTDDIEQGYAFYLFYTRFDPRIYQQISKSQNGYSCRTIDNKVFGNCTVTLKKGDIVITSKDPSFKNNRLVRQIDFETGEKAVSIYEYE